MATWSQWLLLTYLCSSAAWMDERPVLESRDGNLFISAARDRNITLKILGAGYVNVNEINLLHVASAAQNATHLIERLRTGHLASLESDLLRLSHIVEGPDGLERRIASFKGLVEMNGTLPGNALQNQSSATVSLKVRVLTNKVRRLEDKVRSIESKLKVNECANKPCQNGGSCQDLYEGYQCNCPPNWEGPNCMTDVNECVRLLGTDLGCQNGAACFNYPGSYRCECTPGWHGVHCTTKMSACSTQTSQELCGHGVCVSKSNTLGYTCICDQGWQADELDSLNPACVKDVDECAGNHRPCSVNPWVACRNAPGTFFCDACPRGYTGNGYYCTDIDECLVDNGGCSTAPRVECINTMGSRMCGPCPSGYNGDGVACVYVGGCKLNPCHPLAVCIENAALTSAYVLCRCPSGYRGDGFGPNGCQQTATVVSVPGACSSNPCVHGNCVAGDSGYICACDSGYYGKNCNMRDPCDPNPCKNNGSCSNVDGAAVCNCPSTYTGTKCETPRQSCGGVARNLIGQLVFPNDGFVYQHDQSCAWLLTTNNLLVLNVTFTKFNIEQSTDCKYDFLQIHDGRNAGSQMIGRFCGNALPNGTGNIISSHNSLYFWFHSDSSISHDGFAFHWESIEPICGGALTADYGTISSPGSPGRYPPNRDCYWRISVQPSKRIQLHFGQLMIEEHPTCENDYLEIMSETGDRVGIYCNHTRPSPLIVPGSEAVLHFHSDSAGQDSGFQIHYSTIEGIPGCNGVYTHHSGTISLPTYLNSYHENMQCDWRIQMPVGERIQITWSKFDLESSIACRFDYIEIYDGPSSESPLLGRFCGSTLPPTLKSNSNVLLVVFKSDMTFQKEGFTLSYTVVCGGVFTASNGSFHSPMYPGTYHSSRVCTYEIEQPPGKRIMLNILDMEIEGWNSNGCYFDYLEIFDGDNENSTKLATLCGDETDKPPDPYYSTHNYMLLRFVSDGSIEDRGFNANYTAIDSNCGGLYKSPAGIINSPTITNSYETEDCVWTIQAPPGNVVQLSFLSFEFLKSYGCNSNVKVYENYLRSDMELLGMFCETKKIPILSSQSNTMSIVWHVESYHIGTTDQEIKFIASYLFMDASKVCGGHYMKTNGVIKSPNYPKRYPYRRECVWLIEAANRHKVVLNVQSFDLEPHRSCIFDYLEIRNGGYETSPLIGKFCGTQIPSEIISQTNLLYLKFVSDSSRQFDGFSIQWDSTTSGCGGNMNAAIGDIISPNYPQPYTHSDCTWKITVATGNLVRLMIVDLDLENHDTCRFDYIEIYEDIDPNNRQRFCSNTHPKVIQGKSNTMNVRFRSDYTNFGRGFHLKYETLCQNKLHGFYGVIESPNFPERNEDMMNCTWVIEAPHGNKINLTFSHFELDGLPDQDQHCQAYLDIKEGMDNAPNTQLAKLCTTDSVPRRTISSTQHQVFVHYMATSPTPVSFRLEWLLDGCGGHLTRPFDAFTSPGYPSRYPVNVDCEWLIEVDYTMSVELTIHDINTEMQRGCYFDKLQVYGGSSSEAPLLIEICYSDKPMVYTSFGNKMFVKFHSDMSYAARGFNASYRSVPLQCGGRFTADAGTIYSTNYPKNYPHKQNCEWSLQVAQNFRINLTFTDFDLENSENCTDDHVKIYDGPTRDSPLLATLCRNELPGPFVSTGNEMLVVMKTDSIVSAKGFKAMYHTACGARLKVRDVGYLTPTWMHPDNDYAENCTWTLIAENPEDHVTVTFTHIELGLDTRYGFSEEDDCSLSNVEIHEGPSKEGPSLGKWCKNVVPLPVTSSGNALTVNLVSRYNLHEQFAITYSVLNSACGGNYSSNSGKLASPLYPNSYPLNSECVWFMQNSPGNRLKLTFSEFDLQQSDNCDLDYLEVRENNGIGKLLGVFCGKTAEPIESSAPIWMKFKSDGDGVGKGFVADYAFVGGNELTGPTGRITSPMFPKPTKSRGLTTWRITVEFQELIRIEIKNMLIETFATSCYSHLKIYDGYNNEAPVLLETCSPDDSGPVTTSSNVAYIEFLVELVFTGSWFDLTWVQVPMVDNGVDTDTQLANCTELINLENDESRALHSPGWPDGYDNNLQCTWVFTCTPGWHIDLRLLILDLEEMGGCAADSLSVYDGDALNAPDNAKLLERMCYSNSSYTHLRTTDNVMTVKFESDFYVNKTGFNAYVRRDCGGKLYGPNGEINVDPVASTRGIRSWHVSCEWIVQVKPGRTIEVKVTETSTETDLNCAENYLLLKNGDESTSYLLGDGNYCANVKPPTLNTTGNRLYVKYVGVGPKAHLKLLYREIGMYCGGEYILRGKEMKISTPNYPNIPPPYSECMWSIMVPSRERITVHFIERFDLSNSENCEREYVEVRDGGTESSKLLGRFCKDVAPSSMSTTGNMVYIHFYSDLPEPKNGFRAEISVGEACGGIIRGSSGVISSPNYPFFYKKNETCTWTIIAPVDHTLQLGFRDLDLPQSFLCTNTDHLVIEETNPENDTMIDNLATICGSEKRIIETSSNKVLLTFKSDNFEYHTYRGFSLNFSSSAGACGGSLTALSGTIKSNGYPNVATRSRYCDWRIKLPLGFQVVLDVDDIDIASMAGSLGFPMRSRPGFLSFYNDLKFRSKIKSEIQNNTLTQIRSSSNTMTVGYFSSPGYRGFKAHYYASIPAPCGGAVKNIKGNLTAPTERPYNESSYYCEWRVEAPDTMKNNMTDSGITLSIWAIGFVGGIRGVTNWKFCYNYQYISLVDYGQICGNLTEPKHLRSPNPVNEVVIVNGTHGKQMNFVLQYEWQPCGGTLEGPTHVIETPKNISFPISCAWNVNYPDTGELIKLSFLKMSMGSCDKTYLSIRNGGPLAPLIGTYCGNIKPDNITSSGNRLWIEYFAKSEPNEFKIILESANNGCGGAVRGRNKQIASPKFPNQYPNHIECSWEITAENGHHVGLVFTNRFNLEGGIGCTNDYVEMFDWIETPDGNSTWKSLGRVCGRNTPPSFNSTSKHMKVIFHSNDKVQGDGFTALWYENCGGVFEVTQKTQVIMSPSYPNLYKPNLFCNYTLVAPGHDIVVVFTEFQLERSRRDCQFDNVTILSENLAYYVNSEEIYCGENKPLPVMSRDKVEILFKTDSYIQRTGFVFQYFIKNCGGEMTEPGVIEPLMRGGKYFGGVECHWTITAPPDKNIALNFEKFVLEYSPSCYYDWVDIYDGPTMDSETKLARLCGNLTAELSTIRSKNNSMVVHFNSDTNREYEGFEAKVQFVKSVEAGCGGVLQLASKQRLPFKTQKGSTYDSLEECYWIVEAPAGMNVKFTIDSMDLKNATNKTSSKEACTGDFIDIRDGSNPFAESIGKYCGDRLPSPLFTASDTMFIRFFSDSNLEGTGVSGTLEAVDAFCGISTWIANETMQLLTSPNYPNSYNTGTKCRWSVQTAHGETQKIKIQFLDVDLAASTRCETDYIEITDKQSRKYIEEGFGQNFIWSGQQNDQYADFHAPTTSVRYCGKELPHEYYCNTNEVLITFKGDSPGHRGFKLEFNNATCSRNYTSEQGRIVHEGTNECWNTITAPANHTIALYFNRMIFYNPEECTNTAIEFYEGGFNGRLLAKLCGVDTPPPIFSVGNKLSIHSWSEWQSMYEYYDITFTTTNAGRGCGGRIYNYAGTFTSPLYPNEYRNNTVCTWDVSVPRGLKVLLKFEVFDIGSNTGCENKANTLKLYEPAPDGERTLANTYCGGDNPAPFFANGERILVEYTSTMNNVGTGWVILFKGIREGETSVNGIFQTDVL
ncbi:cubilin [Lasioglossum baleicum]|uniref:cubilin n=1 Tax=Lasioglossum baleicum TaxID=434251 RepID=UPI003FCEAE2C